MDFICKYSLFVAIMNSINTVDHSIYLFLFIKMKIGICIRNLTYFSKKLVQY